MNIKSPDLQRFRDAHQNSYQTALAEIKGGRKMSHWMWYIFPQISGLGRSSTSQYYAIHNMQEAIDFMNDPILGSNLIEISETLLLLDSNNAREIFGHPDHMKLKSSMTLFSVACPECPAFHEVLKKFFDGKQDKRTLHILGFD